MIIKVKALVDYKSTPIIHVMHRNHQLVYRIPKHETYLDQNSYSEFHMNTTELQSNINYDPR